MKNKIIGLSTILSTLLVAVAVVVGISGCGSSSTNSTSLVTGEAPSDIEVQNNIITVNIVDGEGNAVRDASVSIIGLATDLVGNDLTESVIKTNITGLVTFYSKIGENIKLIINKDNYINTGVEIKVTEGANSKKVVLIEFNQDKVPDGVTIESEEVTTSSEGETLIEEKIEVKTASDETSVLEITIPKDTVLKTEDGDLVTGKVSMQVVYYAPEAVESFPGGMSAVALAVPQEDGSTSAEAIDFVSGGFTSIQMTDEEGNVVKEFENSKIEISMILTKDTINPETGNLVAVGDQIPIWSYDEITGTWSYEEIGTVEEHTTDNNLYVVVYQASHLSYWNLDWHRSPVCTPARIDISDLETGTTTITSLNISGTGFTKTVFDYNGDGFYDLDNVPKTIPLTLTLSYDGQVRDSQTVKLIDTNCQASLSVGEVVTKTPVKVTVKEQCSDGTKSKVVPSVPGYLMSGGAWTYLDMASVDGELSVMIDPGATESTRLYSFVYGRGYVESYAYLTIPAGATEDQEIVFTLGSQWDSYCYPTDLSTN